MRNCAHGFELLTRVQRVTEVISPAFAQGIVCSKVMLKQPLNRALDLLMYKARTKSYMEHSIGSLLELTLGPT